MAVGFYLPLTLNDNDDTNEEWITSTISDASGKLQLVKVLAIQLFNSFEELARPYNDVPKNMIGEEITTTPDDNSAILSLGDDSLHIVSLLLVVPISYKCGMHTVATIMQQMEQMETYHPLMGL
eukprot:10094566-Ditylum_brightwellii.AAC.1